MTNFPENEEMNMKGENGGEQFAQDEFSTVFSDPNVHKQIKPKKKHRLVIAIASLLCVSVLVTGTVLLVDYFNKLKAKEEAEKEKQEANSSAFLSETEIVSKESDELKSLTLKNDNGTIEFYSERKKAKKTDSETKEETVTWYIKNAPKKLLDLAGIETFVADAAKLSSKRDITEKTAKECGLDKPVITVQTVDTKSQELAIMVGSESPDKMGYYAKTSLADNIYLVDSSYVEKLLSATALDFADASATTSFEAPEDAEDYLGDDGSLMYFDKLTIKGKNFSDTLVIENNPNKKVAEYVGYVITSPSERIAQNVESVMTVFTTGLTAEGAYSFDVSENSLKKMGLNSPDFVTTLEVKKKTLTFKFKLQDDGSYAVINDDSKLIYKVGAETVSSFMDLEMTDYYASWICLYSIDDLKSLKVTVADKTYNFGIAKNEDENSEDGYIITLGDKKIDCQSFQNVYQCMISLACTDFTVDKTDAKPYLVLDFDFSDKDRDNSVVEFTKAGATRYQYSIQGIDMGKTTSSSVNKFVKYLEKMIAGETIGQIN